LNVEYNRLYFCIVVSLASFSVRLILHWKFSPLYISKISRHFGGQKLGRNSESERICPESYRPLRSRTFGSDFGRVSAHITHQRLFTKKVAGEHNSTKTIL